MMTVGTDRDDRALAAAMAAGDSTALDTLYAFDGSLALGVAMRLLGDRRNAEEVVQDAFLQIWRHAAEYSPQRASLRTWLLNIVRHRCIDQLRRSCTRPQTVAWEPYHPEEDPAVDPAEEVERRQLGATLWRAVCSLPAKQREAVELAFFQERSHREIADQLGLPLGTVKGRIRLGLTRLRETLADDPSLRPVLETLPR